MRIAIALLAPALLLAACATPPATPVPGLGPFDRRLAEEYQARRDAEYAERDFRDARRFRRARDAALLGQRPPPDDLAGRDLAEGDRAELAAARDRLVAVLGTTAVLVAPDALAEAQSAFDCWVQEVEEQLQPDDIATCEADFLDRVAAAEAGATAPVVVLLPSEDGGAIVVSDDGAETPVDTPFGGVVGGGAEPAAAEFEETAVTEVLADALDAAPPAQRIYLIYFETGGSDIDDITEESRAEYQAAIDDALATEAARLTVFGHTDRVGSATLNVRLARARAARIAAALVAAGVPAEIVAVDSFGETQPLVPTPDGVGEPLNRRVEIAVR